MNKFKGGILIITGLVILAFDDNLSSVSVAFLVVGFIVALAENREKLFIILVFISFEKEKEPNTIYIEDSKIVSAIPQEMEFEEEISIEEIISQSYIA